LEIYLSIPFEDLTPTEGASDTVFACVYGWRSTRLKAHAEAIGGAHDAASADARGWRPAAEDPFSRAHQRREAGETGVAGRGWRSMESGAAEIFSILCLTIFWTDLNISV
jgi:hypothetical protein